MTDFRTAPKLRTHPDPQADIAFGAVRTSQRLNDSDVIAELTPGLRVIRGDVQWIVQHRSAKTWSSSSYCATKEGLLLRVKDHLLKQRLTELGHYNVKQVKVPDSKTGRLVYRNIVTKEALDATDAARAALKRGDVVSFGVAPEAWAVIEALPDYFSKTLTATA